MTRRPIHPATGAPQRAPASGAGLDVGGVPLVVQIQLDPGERGGSGEPAARGQFGVDVVQPGPQRPVRPGLRPVVRARSPSAAMDTIEKTAPNLKYLQPPLLLRNDSGRFVRVVPGGVFETEWAGRGAAFGDLDNDGDVDVVVGNLDQRPLVLRNDVGNRRNWLALRTVGRTSNRDGIGCRVKVVSASGLTQHFTVTTTAGYLSASDKRLVVGLGGDSTAALVEIRWPSGAVQTFADVKAGQTLTATEPAPSANGFAARAAFAKASASLAIRLRSLSLPGVCYGETSPKPWRMRGARTSQVGADDYPPRDARAAGVLCRCVRPGGLVAQRQAAAPRQALRTAFSRPFHRRCHRRPGLTQPIVYGGEGTKSYIIEVVGCGVAFLDYDNDGWLDLFILNGTRLEGAPPGRPIACTRTIVTARSPMSPRKPG